MHLLFPQALEFLQGVLLVEQIRRPKSLLKIQVFSFHTHEQDGVHKATEGYRCGDKAAYGRARRGQSSLLTQVNGLG